MSPFRPEGSDAPADDRRTCYSIERLPDLNFLANKNLQNLLPVSKIPPESYSMQLEWLIKFQLASAPGLENQHASSLKFLQDIVANLTIDAVPYFPFEKWWKYSRNLVLKQQFYNEVEARNAEGALLIRMGSTISSILKTSHLMSLSHAFQAQKLSNLSPKGLIHVYPQQLLLVQLLTQHPSSLLAPN